MDIKQFMEEFQDYLAPRLDTFEQAIYLYIFPHSRLIGIDEVTIGLKNLGKQSAFGVGRLGTGLREGTIYQKVRSLASKQCNEVLGAEQMGTRVHLRLPGEIPGVIPEPQAIVASLEEMDFFEVPENGLAILEREDWRCFYCLRKLDETRKDYVIEHVFRPKGDNSYRNVAGACRGCNNKKNDMPVEDFLRRLYRDGVLIESELQQRLHALRQLKDGELKPHLTVRAANLSKGKT
jgi:hypothetical protein